MKLSDGIQQILRLVVFRKKIGVGTSTMLVKQHWGEALVKDYNRQFDGTKHALVAGDFNRDAHSKMQIALEGASKLKLIPFIEFVAVSGSVASGNPKEEDDIDLFIVCRNHSNWLTRGLILLLLGNTSKRVEDGSDKDLFCINFVVEERGLEMSNQDIFTLNELLQMQPVLNPEYKDRILGSNNWIESFGIGKVPQPTKRGIGYALVSALLFPVNFSAMLSQFGYMFLRNHKPNLKRFWRNYKSGRLTTFPETFRDDRLEEFEREWNWTLEDLPTTSSATTKASTAKSATSAETTASA